MTDAREDPVAAEIIVGPVEPAADLDRAARLAQVVEVDLARVEHAHAEQRGGAEEPGLGEPDAERPEPGRLAELPFEVEDLAGAARERLGDGEVVDREAERAGDAEGAAVADRGVDVVARFLLDLVGEVDGLVVHERVVGLDLLRVEIIQHRQLPDAPDDGRTAEVVARARVQLAPDDLVLRLGVPLDVDLPDPELVHLDRRGS